jgi:hypothetical protein
VLGSSPSIESIESLPSLRDLSFRQVRGLEALEHVYLYSVPRLQTIAGFSALPAVKSLFAYDSGLELLESVLPSTLTHLQLMTKRMKGRDAHEARVGDKGLTPAVHPDAHFFYK